MKLTKTLEQRVSVVCLGSPLWELSGIEIPNSPSSHPFFSQEVSCQSKMPTWEKAKTEDMVLKALNEHSHSAA